MGTDEKKDLPIREMDLEEVLAETDPFQAHGIALLKVTKGDEIRIIKVPIRSIPQELLDLLNREAPRPPSRQQRDGASRQIMLMPDYGDAKYQEALQKHNERVSMVIVGHGIDIALTFREGLPATTPEEKTKALQERGLSISHFLEIASTILNLTQWTEDERERHFR